MWLTNWLYWNVCTCIKLIIKVKSLQFFHSIDGGCSPLTQDIHWFNQWQSIKTQIHRLSHMLLVRPSPHCTKTESAVRQPVCSPAYIKLILCIKFHTKKMPRITITINWSIFPFDMRPDVHSLFMSAVRFPSSSLLIVVAGAVFNFHFPSICDWIKNKCA